MAKQNRETLKRFFSAGKLPSEEHFADLIDSSLNVTDEGFSKSEDFGFEVTPQKQDEDCLLYTSPSPRDRTRSRMPSSA